MVEWLVVWGATQAVGLVFKPILEDLAKDAAKDWAKDLLKGIPGNLVQQLKKEDIEIAAGKALKEFFQLMQQELEDADLEVEELKQYIKPLKQFINDKEVKEILGNAFNYECHNLDTQTLEKIWYELNLLDLPEEFNWKQIGKRYLKKVKAIIRETDKLRSLLDSQNLESAQASLKQIAGIATGFDLIKYQEAIRECYGNLKLDSLYTTGSAYNELKLWRMFVAQNVREVHQVLPQIHELPKEHFIRLRVSNQLEAEEIALEELERHKRSYFEQPIRCVLDIVNNKQAYKYIVILGDPGSGKSTLLQYLALNWAESPLNNTVSQPIPLLIELRTYIQRRKDKECQNVLEFFHKCSGVIHHLNQNQLHEQLKFGNALVMFDGLDEIFDPRQREDVITDIHRFTNQYPNVQVIVTSRVIGYKPQRLRDAEFHHFMLQDLESEQIREFIERWHHLTFNENDAADRDRKKERLQKAINESKAISELAGNPLLLTMMAILNRNQELPRDRATLYKEASRVLLYQWDVEAKLLTVPDIDPYTIDLKDKQAILRQVAYKMQAAAEGLKGNVISKDDLENTLIDYLKGREIPQERRIARLLIEQLRERNFILCFLGADYYAFVHRTFLEYFCAWEFVWKFEKERSISIEELKTQVFGKHWQDETWHEVLRLIAGMIDAKFVGEILEYLMLMVQNGKEEKILNIFLAAECIFLVAECFAEVKNPLVIKPTADKLLNQLKELQEYSLHCHYGDSDEEEYIIEISIQAIATIAAIWKDNSDTLHWLKDCATADNFGEVRSAAIVALASNFKDHPNTLSFLKDRATADNSGQVRGAAIQALASNFKDHPDTLSFLKDRAIADQSSDVRGVAIIALASDFKDHPDTLSFLKDRAIADNSKRVQQVRVAVILALARNFKDHPDTLSLLKDHAIADQSPDVRGVAIVALASYFKDHPDTLSFLRDLATADQSPDVREYAQNKLKELGGMGSENIS